MISIVIPTYCPVAEVDYKLRRCLKLIMANTDMENAEIVIIEQGNPVVGMFIDQLFAHGVKNVTYRRYANPLGFARAVNIGVSLASGDHYLIVNNDIDVSPGWAEKLVAAYERTPKAGMLSAACTDPKDACDTIEEPSSWWSCVCISRKVWEHVGPLDDVLLNYRLHDQDWSIRAFTMGLVIGRYRGVTVIHDDCSTYKYMNVDETPERTEMVRRWGYEHFSEYVEAQGISCKF